METRRVQLIGGSTYVVSLPKKWVMESDVKKKSEIGLVEQSSGYLVVIPKPEDLEHQVEGVVRVRNGDDKKYISRSIIARYLNGCDVIRIISKDRLEVAQIEEIKSTTRKLIGLETIEENSNEISLHSLLNLEELEILKGIKRAHAIASSMQSDAIKALEQGDPELARSAVQRDSDVDRLYFLTLRQLRLACINPDLSNRLGLAPINCLDYELVIKRIEHIADHAERMAGHVLDLANMEVNNGIVSGLVDVNNDSLEIHKGAMDALFTGNVELANEVIDLRDGIRDKRAGIGEHLADESVVVNIKVNAMLDSTERIADYGTDIAEVAINQSQD
jgi:phosphate uptake regulator